MKCVECGVHLHKTHHFVLFGHRCSPCYQAMLAAEAAAHGAVMSAVEQRAESEG